MAKISRIISTGREKEFLKLFDQLTYSRSAWQVWDDLMTVMACSICNAVDRRKEQFEKREAQYKRAIKNLGGTDIPAQVFSTVVMALEEDPNQDFLGELYMNLNLGNHWKGQFFTHYHVCEMMAMIALDGDVDAASEIKRKGYISVADCCVGGGAMLIAAAGVLRKKQINYQNSVIFVGQDIDRIVAMMAYIQLSLLGCPGYIIVGDSLLHPPEGHILFPKEDEYREVWFTPMFMTDVWHYRKMFALIDAECRSAETQARPAKEKYFMFFNFNEQEDGYEHDEKREQHGTTKRDLCRTAGGR